MKKLLIACMITVLTTTGCFFPRRGGPGWHYWHGELNVAPAVATAGVPATVVTPPALAAPEAEVMVAAR